jgi:hypothetical protein
MGPSNAPWEEASGGAQGRPVGSVDHAPAGNNGHSGQWLELHVLQPLKVARSDRRQLTSP